MRAGKTIEVRGDYIVRVGYTDDDPDGIYQVFNQDTGVVEMSTSLLPQAVRYMHQIAQDWEDYCDGREAPEDDIELTPEPKPRLLN